MGILELWISISMFDLDLLFIYRMSSVKNEQPIRSLGVLHSTNERTEYCGYLKIRDQADSLKNAKVPSADMKIKRSDI